MPLHTGAEVHLQQVITLVDRIIGAESMGRGSQRTTVGVDESILPQLLSHIDEHGMPAQVDMSYVVHPGWRQDMPLYEQVKRQLTPRTKFRALCVPDEASYGTKDEIPLSLRPALVHIRTAWKPIPEFALLGQETALVKTRIDKDYALVISVRIPELVRSLADAFERNWKLSLTPRRYRKLKATLESPINQMVLRQLQAGYIDEVAARQMDVSVRTYRRYISSLMNALDVHTRFQVAWRLAQLGHSD